jgi:hypothetical protein
MAALAGLLWLAITMTQTINRYYLRHNKGRWFLDFRFLEEIGSLSLQKPSTNFSRMHECVPAFDYLCFYSWTVIANRPLTNVVDLLHCSRNAKLRA